MIPPGINNKDLMKIKNLLKQNVYSIDGFFISKDNKPVYFKNYKVYAGKLPGFTSKTENEMTESEKAFDSEIWHYFKSKKELARYYLFNSLEHNFFIQKITGINLKFIDNI